MVLYLILTGFDKVSNFVISLIPTFETPAWIVQNLPNILETIFGYNNYLPIIETLGVVIFLLTFTLNYKVLKIILEKVGVNMNA